jgi:hypothetical protein
MRLLVVDGVGSELTHWAVIEVSLLLEVVFSGSKALIRIALVYDLVISMLSMLRSRFANFNLTDEGSSLTMHTAVPPSAISRPYSLLSAAGNCALEVWAMVSIYEVGATKGLWSCI